MATLDGPGDFGPERSRTPLARRSRGRLFFVAIAVLMLVVVALGFGKSFFLRPVFIDQPLPVYLIVHGVTMTAWFLLFLVQATLVSAKRTDLHKKLGLLGLALAMGVVVTAVVLNLNLVPRALAAGAISKPEEGAAFALGSLSSLIPFVLLVGVAIVRRRKPQIHKRLMFWAFVWMLGPAFTNTRPLGRVLDPLVAPFLPFFPSDFVWLFALVAYDWITLRRIHPATYVPFILLFLFFIFAMPWISESEALQRWLLALSADWKTAA